MTLRLAIAKYSGILAGLSVALILLLFRLVPYLAESIYGKGIYPIVRWLIDHSLGKLSFPIIYLLVPVGIGMLVIGVFQRRKRSIVWLLNILGWLFAGFYMMWGFNYARPGLMDRISSENQPIENRALIEFGNETVSQLNRTWTETLLSNHPNGKALEDLVRPSVSLVLTQFGLTLNTTCRTRELEPAGVLRKFGITGIYMPFTGAGLLEAALPHPEKSFVIAHELAHGFGVTDEGEANLVAYLACISSNDQRMQYAGHMAMFEYLMVDFTRKGLSAGLALKDSLSLGVRKDLERLRTERRKYQEWIPNMGEQFNDAYLKFQGIESGTAAYQALPELYLRTRTSFSTQAAQ